MLLNIQIWKSVIEAAKTKVANQSEWLRAIDRGVIEIEKARYWAFADGVLTIESTTSKHIYKVSETHSCQATENGHKACKHVAARRLMQRYHEKLSAVDAPTTKADAPAAPVSTPAQRKPKHYPEGLMQTRSGEAYRGITI